MIYMMISSGNLSLKSGQVLNTVLNILTIASLYFCRYSYIYGPDWKIINGENESGYSQMASRNSFTKRIYLSTFDSCNSRSGSQPNDGLDFVWNLPIELTMSSSNVHGWPQLAVSVYGLNFFGLDVVRG